VIRHPGISSVLGCFFISASISGKPPQAPVLGRPPLYVLGMHVTSCVLPLWMETVFFVHLITGSGSHQWERGDSAGV
jgi:hypothetical protein